LLENDKVKRKVLVDYILAINKADLDVNKLQLLREGSLGCFWPLNCWKKYILIEKEFFS
jgi:hypothetical protein